MMMFFSQSTESNDFTMLCSGTTYQQQESWLVCQKFNGLQYSTISLNHLQVQQVLEHTDKKTVSAKQTLVFVTTTHDHGSIAPQQ
jgi:hypothetical protein